MSNLLENLNNEQLSAVKHGQGPLLIVAGAGTGKTTVITRRIAHLVEEGLAKPEEILALTFTEKAAGEMQERVELLMPLGYYDMWISTFHAFCERVLKAHGIDIGLPNDFKLLDGVRQWIFVYNNFEKFKLDYYRPLGSPNRFIDALLSHFSRCKDEMISPEQYLEYAQGLKLSQDSAEGLKVQEPKDKNQMDSTSSPQAKIKSKKLKTQTSDENPIDSSEIARLEEVSNAFHTYQKLLVDNNSLDFGDLINFTLELFQKRPKILEFYQKKFKFIMVDEFQDTNFAQYQLVKMLADRKKGSVPIYGLPKAVEADESARYTEANLVVVGDDDQSIYKFRGASVSNILKFKEDFPRGKQVTLTENYRSTQNILDLSYNFIQANNPNRLEEKLGIDKKLKANTTPKDKQGIIEVLEGRDLSEELNLVVKKILEIKNQPLPNEVSAEDKNLTLPLNEQPLSWNDFAILIRANSAAEELIPVLSGAGIPYTFFANRGLYKKPIIVDVLSYMRLLDNAHDSVALYRVLTLPKFYLSHEELSSLLEYAKKKALSLHEALTPALTLAVASAESRTKIRTLLDLLRKHSADSKNLTAAEMMVDIVAEIGMEAKLREDTQENAQNRELLDQFYKKIEDFEKQSEHRDLHAFLSSLDLEMQAGSEGEIKFDPSLGPESVKVLTIHSAKGLEFKYVFIINMVEQRFPTRQKGESIAIPEPLIKDILPEGDFHLQEERRLFYVALTRAREGLFLSWAKDYGGKTLKRPSPFLVETKLVPSENKTKATGEVIFSKAKKEKIIYHRIPAKFSFSDINTFENCPLRFKYECYLKLPVRGSQQISFGITIHKVLEQFYKLYRDNLEKPADLFGNRPSEHPVPDYEYLLKLYKDNWIDDWYDNKTEKEKYRKEGVKMLKLFYDDLSKTLPKPKYIEKFFSLKLGAYDFVGKIDRGDKLDGGLEIVDYKTGKTPKNKKDLDQLYIYQWAAQEFLKEKVEKLRYWYLKDGDIVEEELAGEKEIGELKEKLLATIEKIIDAIKFDRFKELHGKTRDHDCDFSFLE